MDRIIHYLRARVAAQARAATTFCEGCGGVCTPECRRAALLEHQHATVQRAGLVRF